MNQQLPLRDIHLPEAILWWPLALGWWLLLMILLLGLYGLIRRLRYRKRHPQIHTIAYAVKLLKKLAKQDDKQLLIRDISSLLRRVSISLYGRKQVAGLSGESWLKFLDRKGETTEFTKGVGRILVDLPYQKYVNYQQQDLLLLVHQWLLSQRNQDV